jgi:hypothetical protein
MSAHRKGEPKASGTAIERPTPARRRWYRSASPFFRVVHGVAVLTIAFGLASDAIGGQWMRIGTAIMGAGFLPFGLLVLTNFRGEYERLVSLFTKEDPDRMVARTLPRDGFRYGIGILFVLVAMLFLVAGIAGGRGVTKPGLF